MTDSSVSAPVADPDDAPTMTFGRVPGAMAVPHAEAPTITRELAFSRRVKRITETQEIQIRSTHRRRKVLTRGGVLAGFGLAMVVYPIMGNVATYANSVESVPGVVVGEAPTTGQAILGNGPALISSRLELPTVDEQAHAIATSDVKFSVNDSLPGCLPKLEYSTDNGHIPDSDLCRLWDGNYLRSDAALALAQMNEVFKTRFGRNICIVQGYRSYGDQIAIKKTRGYLAAKPGTSVHGLGLAFDLCSGDDKGAPKAWLDANGATYGFENPFWAKSSKWEPWHWEYKPGTDAIDFYGTSGWQGDGGGSAPDATTTTTTTTTTAPPAADPSPAPVVSPAPTG